MKETDLYPHIKTFLEDLGYTVKSEVADCDVMAEKDGQLLAVEMKTGITIRLLAQAAKRQKIMDIVYIAVPKPAFRRQASREFQDLVHLIRRLNLGLLLVQTKGEGYVEEAFPPKAFDYEPSRRRNTKRRTAALHSFRSLSGDENTGGSVKTKRMTPYKENALLVALHLEQLGTASAAQLVKLGCCEKTHTILYMNHYGWFERVSKGQYTLTRAGRDALETYANVCGRLKKTITQ